MYTQSSAVRSWGLLCTVFLAVIAASTPLHAIETSWTAGTGMWNNAGNWDNGVPSASVDAIVNNGGTAQVVYFSGVSHLADTLYVGYQKTSPGAGSGYVEILVESGAAYPGSLQVSQARLGYLGADSFGRVTCEGFVTYGSGSTGPAALRVSGSLEVGCQGVGELRLINGGMAMAASCDIGAQASSSGDALVSGPGSSLWVSGSSTGPLNVGAYGQGSLTFLDGGHSNCWGGTNIAAWAGSTGTLEVRHNAGPDQPNLWTSHTEWSGRVVVGGRYDDGLGQPVAGGQGELIIVNNPALGENHAAFYCIRQSPWSSGTIWVTSSGIITLNGGEMGTEASADDRGEVIIESGGMLRGNGRIFSKVRNHGSVTPGLSTGRLTAVYDYQQFADGLLEIQLGGYNAGQPTDGFDVLAGGGASLAGELRIELLPGFTPQPGDIFEFLRTEGPILGDFDTKTLVNFPSSLSAIVRPGDHGYPSMVIEIIPEPATLLLMSTGGILLLRSRRSCRTAETGRATA